MKFEVPNNYCELYRQNLISTVRVAESLNVSDSTILRDFKSKGIIRNYDNKAWLTEKYNNEKLTIGEIARLANCVTSVITNRLKKYKIVNEKTSIRNKKYTYNLDFFNNVDTPLKAYWLGFLYADGNIDDKHNCISLKLQEADEAHVKKFVNVISEDELKITRRNNYDDRTGKTYYRSEVKICSKTIVNQLRDIGVEPNRKHLYKLPKLSKELERHFIRGYLDGDGCVYESNGSFGIMIAGGLTVVRYISEYFGELLMNTFTVVKSKNKKLYLLTIGGNIQVNAVMCHLYYGVDSPMYLDRKYNKWYKNFIENTSNIRYSLIFAEMQRVREKLPNPCFTEQE